MKNDRIIKAYNEIQPDEYAKQRVLNRVMEPKRKRRLVPAVAGMAAVLIIALFVNSILPAQITENQPNAFTVRVYAAAHPLGYTTGETKIEQSEVELVRQPPGWGGYHDGENLFIGITLEVMGENIEHVEFNTREGQFAKQYHSLGTNWQDRLWQGDETPIISFGSGDEHFLVTYGTEFEMLGNKISFDEIRAENVLLFIVLPVEVEKVTELGIVEIDVRVRFFNGEEQTKTAELNFGVRWGRVHMTPEAHTYQYIDGTYVGIIGEMRMITPNFYGVDLDELILIPESVQTLVPYADFHCMICTVDYPWCLNNRITHHRPSEEELRWENWQMYVWLVDPTGEMGFCGARLVSRYLLFEKAGVDIYKIDIGRPVDGEYTIVPVVKLIDDDLVGMIYRLPDELADRWGL